MMTHPITQEPNARGVLYGKIAAVAAAVSRIPKNGRNNFHNYTYATESDITDGLRELLNANGLAFLPPSVISWERDETADNPKIGPRTRVQVQFALGCSDTGETFTTILWGEANDNADKGFYKAYTGAVKYYLMKTFLIATGDDPEQDNHQQRDTPATYKQPTARPPVAQKPAQRATAPNGSGTIVTPVCDICGATGRIGKDGKSYYCPEKDKHGGKWYTIPTPAPARTIPDDWDAIEASEASR